MPRPIALLRNRVPALCLAVLFHVVLIVFLLHAIPKQTAPVPAEQETQLVLLPLLEPAPIPKRHRTANGGGSNAITTYFNPYTFNPQSLQAPQQRLGLALASCEPENYDKQSVEVRAACARIRMVVANDTGRFGVTIDFTQGERWERELLRRQTPVLAPCMTPGGPDVLYLLYCVYDVVAHGYDSEKMPRYSK